MSTTEQDAEGTPEAANLDGRITVRFPEALAGAAKHAAVADGYASPSEWIRAMVDQEIRRRDGRCPACGSSPPPAAALDRPTIDAEPAGEPLTGAQCDRLRQLVAEHQDALSAVRRALDLTAALDDADREIIAAGRAGLKVLEGAEEETHHA